MKFNKIYSAVAATVMAFAMTGCDEERDFIVIDGNLPIKTSTFYIVGDATPNGWNIDAPTACVKKSAYVYVYEGELKPGEMKACAITGS